MEASNDTFCIPAAAIPWLEERLADLNKRAAKLGCPPASFSVERWEEIEVPHDFLESVFAIERFAHVRVEGEAPKLAGWSFVAKLQPVDEGANLIKTLPGVESIPDTYRTAPMACDHCHTNRLRNEVFVVHHDEQGYRQIGRNCLADFLGGTSPETLARRAEWLLDLADLGGDEDAYRDYARRLPHTESTEAFVATVAAFVRSEGWVPRSKSLELHKSATADLAWTYLIEGRAREEWDKRGFSVTPADVDLARTAIAWARDIDPGTSDYLYNLKTVAQVDTIDGRMTGIIASVVSSYQRAVEKRIEREKQAEKGATLSHVGVVGKRETFPNLTVANTRTFDGDYGVRTLVTFNDEAGNVLSWWTGDAPRWATQGAVVSIKATVKKHDTYRDTPQTVVTRATPV